MHVCTCENRDQLLTIEERLEGVRKVFCDNFSGCGETKPVIRTLEKAAAQHAARKRPEAFPVETSGLIYLKAVNDHVKRQHALEIAGAASTRAPVAPMPAVIAPVEERRSSAPVLALVGMLSVGLAVLALEYTRGVGGPPPPDASLSAALGGLAAPADEGGEQGSLTQPGALTPLTPAVSRAGGSAGAPADRRPAEKLEPKPSGTPEAQPRGDRRLDGLSDGRSKAKDRKRLRERRRARRSKRRAAKRDAAPKVAKASYSVHNVLARAAGPHGGQVASPAESKPAAGEKKSQLIGALPVGKKAASKPQSLAKMLRKAAAIPGRDKAPAKAAPKLPERLTASAIARGASKLRAGAGSCLKKYGFAHLTVRVRLRVTGSTGKVTYARVLGRLRGTPAGKCIKARARSVRFDRFSASKHVVTLPIRIH